MVERPMLGGSYPSTEALLAAAAQRTGLSDFGPGDFVEGLDVLLDSLARGVPYAAPDREKAVALIGRRLDNRLKIEAWFKANPAAEQATIDAPISVVGLPRTGTSALGNMLSRDPQFRCLRPWEQEQPCPPPRIGEEAADPRRIAYAAFVERLLREQPDQAAMHLWDPDATMEDTEVLGLQFRAQQMTMPVFSYHAWWRAQDMRPTFAYHARIARLLQSSRPPNRWLFKAPHHKFHLDHMVDAYPDIRFIFTHRDPAKSVPSYASFVASLYPRDVVERIGRVTIGRHIHNHLLTGMHAAMAARTKLGPGRLLDVHHADFLADPMAVIERIYAWLGLPLGDDVRASFAAWHSENASGAHGTHRYAAADYGLTDEAIRDDYRFYTEAFGIDPERKRIAA
ncbi:sulfotransferase family protein [Sphingomonas jatrophae]|uniref:Sulfotransferase family protein n=1 Tax=Sphingomonas jatrophae TaxID=1166337 RepID=A0A1I6L018_9SPHN|nr:sulfotransferase [Sphingomonas jatrophae]SFR96530.1 Sulfotransferase family protein [Sphingomonas jatrophae]